MKTRKATRKTMRERLLDPNLGGKTTSCFIAVNYRALYTIFVYYNPNLYNKENRKEKINEKMKFSSADRRYHSVALL